MGFITMVLRGVWLGTAVILAVCHLNHPRLWVQDLLCSASLYWIPFVAGDLVRNCLQCAKTRALPVSRLVLVVAQAYLVVRVAELALPFYAPQAPVSGELAGEVSVLFSHVDFGPDGLPRLAKEAAARKPDIVVLVGERQGLDAAQAALAPMPSALSSEQDGARGVRILSALEPQAGTETGLGVGVLPSLFVRLQIPQSSTTLLLGALDLLPAASQDDFFQSKVTSRRIATLMRYAPEPRIVVGSFEATPFSPLVSMYVRQVHLRSVMFGRGLWRTFDARDPLIRMTLDHAFVSGDMEVSSLDMIGGISARRVSIAFTARLPKS